MAEVTAVPRVIRAHLEGVDAEPGRVAAADVARIITGLERAIACAAYLVLKKQRRGTGRHQQVIESASRLTFVGVERGSFVELLELPDVGEPSDDELPISVAALSSQAFDRVLTAINDDGPAMDPELARAIAQMAGELGIGDRNHAITIGDRDAAPPQQATIDSAVRTRMTRYGRIAASLKDETIVGLLVEADFEDNTARLRLADGGAVNIHFPAEMADEIQVALRSRAGFEGVVRYDPHTSQAASVEVRAVKRNAQLVLDSESFWKTTPFSELQAAQSTSGIFDPDSIAITDLADDERATFLAALAE
jgi:hypothetical protein